jgi:hypothetical protein
MRVSHKSIKSWNDLEDLLRRIASQIPRFTSSPISLEELKKTDRDKREKLLELKLKPFEPAAIHALTTALSGGALENITVQVGHMALIIVSQIQSFVWSAAPLGTNGLEPILPFPNCTPLEFAEFLVTSWWPEFGWSRLVSDVETRTDETLAEMFRTISAA